MGVTQKVKPSLSVLQCLFISSCLLEKPMQTNLALYYWISSSLDGKPGFVSHCSKMLTTSWNWPVLGCVKPKKW